jgi:thiol-disulfide isomerase/thioredoxin
MFTKTMLPMLPFLLSASSKNSMLSLLLLFTLICASSSFAFLPSSTSHRSLSPLLAVVDISDEATFDSAISGANSLVIVDYSTTWCGPCKVIAPKFEELSEQVRYTHCQMLKYGHIYTHTHTRTHLFSATTSEVEMLY